MLASRKTVPAQPATAPTQQAAVDLESLSRETGVPVDVLRTFAGISDPANAQLFTAESARKAFADLKARRTQA